MSERMRTPEPSSSALHDLEITFAEEPLLSRAWRPSQALLPPRTACKRGSSLSLSLRF